jgi:hypothetical protein
MASPGIPAHGVRILLERAEVRDGEGGARYRGAILAGAARFDYQVRFAADATVEIEPIAPTGPVAEGAPAPPPRALELLRTIARTVGRHAVAESPPAWPRRVLRWRKLA